MKLAEVALEQQLAPHLLRPRLVQKKSLLLFVAALAIESPLRAEVAGGDSVQPPSTSTPEEPGADAQSPVPELTLKEALSQLDAQNLDLRAAQLRAEQAAALSQEAGAGLRPTLMATGSYVRNNLKVQVGLGDFLSQLPNAPNIPNILIQPLDSWNAGGTLRVPLFAPTAWYDVDAAQASEQAAAEATKVTRQHTRAALAQMAYAALALEEVVAAAERAIELAKEQADSAERRVQAGTAAPLDVLRAKTERVRRESDLARARADLDRTRLMLGVLLGEAKMVRIAPDPALLQSLGASASAEQAFAHRPELGMLRARAEAGRAMVKSANSRFLPQLSATGSVFASTKPYPTGKQTGWRVTVDLTVPLYDGGFRYGKRQEAKNLVEQAHTEELKQRLKIRQEIADAQRELSLAGERLHLAESHAELARDAAASARRSFVAGVTSSLDVLDANEKLFQAEVALASEKARQAQSRIELKRALGAL